MDPSLRLNIVSNSKVHLSHTHTGGTDIWPQTPQFFNKCKSTDPKLGLNIVSIGKVHRTYTHTDVTDIWTQTT